MELTYLLALGFDRSTADGTVRCSQCEAVCINGVPCHETGCRNATSECAECGCIVPRGTRLCTDCGEQEY